MPRPTSVPPSRSKQAGPVDPAKPLFMREPLVRGSEPKVYMVTSVADMLTGSSRVSIKEWVQRSGNKRYREESKLFDSLCRQLRTGGGHVFLDSGAFTFQSWRLAPTKGKIRKYEFFSKQESECEAFIESFIQYCRTEGYKYDCYANFDHAPAGAMIYKMQKRLEGEGIFPFPVEHGDDGLRMFQKYIDEGYKFFGISKALRWGNRDKALKFYDRVFQISEKAGVFLHGFAITDVELMFRFPWYSVDSSSWIKLTGYGSIGVVMNEKMVPMHVTYHQHAGNEVFSGDMLKFVQGQVEALGFDFEKMRYWGKDKVLSRTAWNERGMYNIYVLSHLKELGVKMTGGEKRWKSLLTGGN